MERPVRVMKRLYRSRHDRVIGGVCGGIAGHLAADVSLIRLAWVLFSLLGGAGILLYLLAWIIVPEEPVRARSDGREEPVPVTVEVDHQERARLAGIILVAVGGYLLLERVISIRISLWPLLLVFAGVALLLSGRRDASPPPEETGPTSGVQTATGDEPQEKTSYEE